MPQPFLRYEEFQMDLGKQAKDTWSIVGFAAKVHGGAGGPPGALELRSSDSSNLSPEGRIFLEQAHFLHKTCIGKKHTKAHIHTHTRDLWLETVITWSVVSSCGASFGGSKARCASPGSSGTCARSHH